MEIKKIMNLYKLCYTLSEGAVYFMKEGIFCNIIHKPDMIVVVIQDQEIGIRLDSVELDNEYDALVFLFKKINEMGLEILNADKICLL